SSETRDEEAALPRVFHIDSLPPARSPARGLIMVAVGIAISVTAGALTAQYLIPGPPPAPAQISRSTVSAQSTNLAAPIVAPLAAPAPIGAPPPTAATLTPPALPHVPGLAPTNSVALSDLAALPPPAPPSAKAQPKTEPGNEAQIGRA